MIKTKFLKEHGYVLDLMTPYTLVSNREKPDGNNLDINKSIFEKYYDSIIERFTPNCSDLLIFFYKKSNGIYFLLSEYYQINRERSSDIENFKLSLFLNYISDKKRLMRRLYSFYLSIEDSTESYNLNELIQRLNKQDYSGELKFNIISFFSNPTYYIEKLLTELKAKEPILHNYYEENRELQLQLQSDFDAEQLVADYRLTDDSFHIPDNCFIYGISCLIDKNALRFTYFDDLLILIIGYDYKDTLEILTNKNRTPNIDYFGKIISDTNRLSILNLLHINRELCTSEIARILKISIKVLYYHLEMMVDSGILKFRNEGRTLYYFLNYDYFRLALKELSKYEDPNKKVEEKPTLKD